MTISSGVRSGLIALATAVGLAACGGGSDGTPPGTLRVALTDAPACRVDAQELANVYVTVERVRVHASADAGENAAGWTEIAVTPARRIDLLELTNGRLEELGVAPIPAGRYTQVRLVLAGGAGNTAPHALRFAGAGSEVALRTPSAMQSGLKIIRPFTVEPNTLVDLVVDFDACRSIVAMGNGGYALKPTLTAELRTVAGIVGYVDPSATDAMVTAQKNGRVVRSTVPYASGQFVLAYLDHANGPYDFVVTSPTRGTTVVPAVPVSTSAATAVSTQAQPVPLPAAATPATRVASGTLGPVAARETAVVRALQNVGGTVVEVDTSNVNATSGAYALQLPLAAPLRAAYSATLPLAFASPASPPADFRYTLEALASGYATQTQQMDAATTPYTHNWSLVATP